ncbi:MAG: putative immunity protein [Candidatus Gracilibacteria bacterium]
MTIKSPHLVRIDLDKPITELVSKSDHKTLGIWAADCAERVLPYFEKKYPKDNRPRKAIEALRTWVKTGVFKMADIRGYSLAAHAAARAVKETDAPARSAARSAGQAIATTHVARHSIAAAIYAATAVRDATNSMEKTTQERDWQYQHLKKMLY